MAEIRTGIAQLVQRQGSRLAAKLGHTTPLVQWVRPLYSAALGWMAADRGVMWCINGVNYRIDIRHRDRMAHEYESAVATFLTGVVKPGFVSYDVGANVGTYVLQLCHWTGASGRVVAFEPNPEAREVLKRHIAMNGFQHQVTIVPAAVGSGKDHAILHAAGTDGMSRLGMPNPALASQTQALTVPMCAIDDFVRAGNAAPDLILVDVEGYELNVLSSALQTISERRDRTHIVVEMHPTLWASAGTSLDEMSIFLDQLRLRPRCLTGQSDPLREYGLVYLECT